MIDPSDILPARVMVRQDRAERNLLSAVLSSPSVAIEILRECGARAGILQSEDYRVMLATILSLKLPVTQADAFRAVKRAMVNAKMWQRSEQVPCSRIFWNMKGLRELADPFGPRLCIWGQFKGVKVDYRRRAIDEIEWLWKRVEHGSLGIRVVKDNSRKNRAIMEGLVA